MRISYGIFIRRIATEHMCLNSKEIVPMDRANAERGSLLAKTGLCSFRKLWRKREMPSMLHNTTNPLHRLSTKSQHFHDARQALHSFPNLTASSFCLVVSSNFSKEHCFSTACSLPRMPSIWLLKPDKEKTIVRPHLIHTHPPSLSKHPTPPLPAISSAEFLHGSMWTQSKYHLNCYRIKRYPSPKWKGPDIRST